MKAKILCLLCIYVSLLVAGCGGGQEQKASGPQKKISFADVGWDSIKLNNALAALVATNVFDYQCQETPGSTPISHEAIIQGEVDVLMEEWSNNIATYEADLKSGKFQEVGVNFQDNAQGFYIPQYVADQYPDLRTVKDLAKYAALFPDPEHQGKGLIYGGVTGWEITNIMEKKLVLYGLNQHFTYFPSGSDAILTAVMTSAWDKKVPIVAYYWSPTWLLGKYKFVLLQDEPYDRNRFTEGYGACPSVKVTIVVSNKFAQNNSEFCQFLGKFKMTSALISEALAYMQEHKATYHETAIWLVTKSHPELLEQWLTPSQSSKLKASLK